MNGAIPFVTAELPGVGGLLRVEPEDFVVEEVPAYAPSGVGEHAFLWVQKRGITTADAARVLARHAGLRERDVGTAGLKDKRAVTRQLFSLCLADASRFLDFEAPGLRVLWVKRHGNKLKTGHLRGNRFVLTVRGVGPSAEARARDILARLAVTGLPNAYGPQRFGRDGATASLGRALLTGAAHPDRSRAERDGRLRRLALSAFQSQLFNALLVRRLNAATWTAAMPGDVLQKPTGAAFVCEDPAVDQARVDAFELSVAGPMFGPKMLAARGEPLAVEQAVLAEAGVAPSLFERGGELTLGARRPLRVSVAQPRVAAGADGTLEVSFGLPRGSYASVVMAEVMKADVSLEGDGDGESPSNDRHRFGAASGEPSAARSAESDCSTNLEPPVRG